MERRAGLTEKHLRTLFELWQRRLGLQDWSIVVKLVESPEVAGRRCHMSTTRSTYYQRASIDVSQSVLDFRSLPGSIERDLIEGGVVSHEEYVEVSVVHELLHLWNRGIVEAADLVEQDIHPTSRTVWDEAFRREEERMVESLAIALVRNWGT